MKKNIVLTALLLAALAGCSKPETESAPNETWANQNPSGRVPSIEEAKRMNPNTGEIEPPKEENGQK